MNEQVGDENNARINSDESQNAGAQPSQSPGSAPVRPSAPNGPGATVPAAAVADRAAGVSSPEPVEDELYHEEGTWNGLTRWACLRCAFDTVDSEDVMLWHITKHLGENNPNSVEAMAKLATSHGG